MKKRKQRRERHGQAGSPTYCAWQDMIKRCTKPNCPDYHRYGGRGIRVCPRWRRSFLAFLADMGEKPPGLTLDRKDNDGNYEPGNCRWATWSEQAQNRRPKRPRRTTRPLTYNGQTMGPRAWARKIGITESSLYGRLRRGWPLEKALTMVAPR